MNHIDRQDMGMLFLVTAPSGAGKTSLVEAVSNHSANISVSISYTTRPPRFGEQEGQAYHFIDEAMFDEMVKADLFLEYAEIFGYRYGTSREWVLSQLASGQDVVLEIDWQGARNIRAILDNVVGIFIMPPTPDKLEERLHHRGDDEQTIAHRIKNMVDDMSHYKEFDFIVINDKFDSAVADMLAIIRVSHLDRRWANFTDKLVKEILAMAQ